MTISGTSAIVEMQRDYRNIVVGAITVGFGIGILLWAIPYHLDEDPDLRLPVSMLPRIVAWCFIFLGSMLAVSGFSKRPTREAGFFGFTSANTRPFSTAGVFCALIATTAALKVLPYLVVTPVLVFVLSLIYGVRSWRILLLNSLAVPLLIWGGIELGLERPLP